MGLGQIIMSVGATVLLGIVILSANSTLLQNDDVVKDSEFGVAAISLATSMVEEVQGRVFDAAVVDSGVYTTTRLTSAGSLGPEANEQYRPTDSLKTDFDDIDDFNNFSIEFVSDTTRPKVAQYRGDARGFRADYIVRTKVIYVTAGGGSANLATPSASRTWHKELIVTVTSPSSKDTLVFPTVISYWN
jgi:hypothetical protein